MTNRIDVYVDPDDPRTIRGKALARELLTAATVGPSDGGTFISERITAIYPELIADHVTLSAFIHGLGFMAAALVHLVASDRDVTTAEVMETLYRH